MSWQQPLASYLLPSPSSHNSRGKICDKSIENRLSFSCVLMNMYIHTRPRMSFIALRSLKSPEISHQRRENRSLLHTHCFSSINKTSNDVPEEANTKPRFLPDCIEQQSSAFIKIVKKMPDFVVEARFAFLDLTTTTWPPTFSARQAGSRRVKG